MFAREKVVRISVPARMGTFAVFFVEAAVSPAGRMVGMSAEKKKWMNRYEQILEHNRQNRQALRSG